jgi:hypothetical protein
VCASARKGREEIFRKDHIKGLDKGDLVFIIFAAYEVYEDREARDGNET